MPLINTEGLTLSPEEAQSVSEVIFERVFNDGELAEFHDIETGITMKKQIPFAGRIGLLGRAFDGCTPPEEGGFEMSEKFWDPVMEGFRLKHCAADMDPLIKLFRRAQRVNPDFFDRVGSDELSVVITAVEKAMIENLHRQIWFSDKTASLMSAGGNFKTGTDLTYWNTFDGLFKQIFAEVPTTASNYVAIPVNAGANYAAQALAADAAVGIFEKMLQKADSRLLDSGEGYFLATRSLAENYRSTLLNKTLSNGFIEITEGGKQKLVFSGYEVKVRNDWDRWIESYQNNTVKKALPHRAVFTTKANIPVGTLSTEDLDTLRSFFDQVGLQNIMDAAYTLDAKHLEPYMTVAAY